MDCLLQSAGAIMNMGRLQLLDERDILSGESALLAFVQGSDSGDMVHPDPFTRLHETLQSIVDFCLSPDTLAAPHARKKLFNSYQRVCFELIKELPGRGGTYGELPAKPPE
ncbi:MAG: hypothetical protein U5L08_07305 [Xanthomonadales bacterium]|nr:hypothetical protein [Xanthomonadales bacterium]